MGDHYGKHLPRLLIAGTNSGCGKTTVVCAILQALQARGEALATFKRGPDYIDPMFHRSVLGLPCRNLGQHRTMGAAGFGGSFAPIVQFEKWEIHKVFPHFPYFRLGQNLTPNLLVPLCGIALDLQFFGENTLRYLLSQGEGIAIIEGVMGYYDGIGVSREASSYAVAGAAPQSCRKLPAPTHVFIGGSGGNLREILALAREKNPGVRIVAAAIALETVAELEKCRKELGFAHTEVSCLTAAQGHPAGPYALMQGQNPVYLFTFQGD